MIVQQPQKTNLANKHNILEKRLEGKQMRR